MLVGILERIALLRDRKVFASNEGDLRSRIGNKGNVEGKK